YTPALAPGGLVSIFGRRLAVSEAQANRLPLPVDLAGTSVTLNGRKLPLFYVSSSQINAQLPYDVTGPVKLQVTTINGSVDVPAEIAAVAPAIFVFNGSAGLVPAITHSNGVLVSAAAPARPGEILTVYMTGLGKVSGEVLEGQPAPTGVATLLANPVEVRVGAATMTPLFAGLAPGYAGLYQVNFRVPPAAGVQPLEIAVDGVPSNAVTLPVA
ncbi:MAG: IPT/TIG domain-containing protein, partial [Bryobacteraceae bacterium]